MMLSSEVSIHAPREGCDYDKRKTLSREVEFQFTHPGRGATVAVADSRIGGCVSIHAPREGCDAKELRETADLIEFQFTHPGRGATSPPKLVIISPTSFNSRTPGGVRRSSNDFANVNLRFNSRTPGGVRLHRRARPLY